MRVCVCIKYMHRVHHVKSYISNRIALWRPVLHVTFIILIKICQIRFIKINWKERFIVFVNSDELNTRVSKRPLN